MRGKNAVVIGGSRGIGAATVEMFGRRGADVTFTYARRLQRGQQLADRLTAMGTGGDVRLKQLDVCDEDSVDRFVAEIQHQNRAIDYLVLAAAGGLEPGRGESYAFEINDAAPAAMVSKLLPHLSGNALIVYLTSHEAHFSGQQTAHSSYAPVARSKHAGEQRLKSMKHAIESHQVYFNVISGDIVPESATGKLLEYKNPGILEHRRTLVGALPTSRDFADRIEELCERPMREFGAVSYVWEPMGYPVRRVRPDHEDKRNDGLA